MSLLTEQYRSGTKIRAARPAFLNDEALSDANIRRNENDPWAGLRKGVNVPGWSAGPNWKVDDYGGSGDPPPVIHQWLAWWFPPYLGQVDELDRLTFPAARRQTGRTKVKGSVISPLLAFRLIVRNGFQPPPRYPLLLDPIRSRRQAQATAIAAIAKDPFRAALFRKPC